MAFETIPAKPLNPKKTQKHTKAAPVADSAMYTCIGRTARGAVGLGVGRDDGVSVGAGDGLGVGKDVGL